MDKPRIGISSCLAGNPVRYDGRSRFSRDLVGAVTEVAELVSICPEVAIGMGVPRPPIRLTGSLSQPQARGVENPDKVFTTDLQDFALQVLVDHDLDGYIFKARSPSCGYLSTPVFIGGREQRQRVSGVYAQALTDVLPDMPVADESIIGSRARLDRFIERCRKYHRFRNGH